ncbi:hypothetical protein PI95_008245 [Hassallia byssoidea VB512170]|uniref:Lipoprotein n=1 Tax=Hassallia byssoidea VB512170 TaxID=1304833 RepID=A0A846H7A1_9CYAN|nr:hypothetical protein [Hassalia byssoidea]NEU72559.1 hypothetical protein [Hassalia byssoidea VB512170]
MKKIDVAVTIIVIPIISAFLTGCAALDDIARVGGRQGDNLQPNVPGFTNKKPTAVTVLPPKNLNQNRLEKCSRQTGKSAVVEAWNLASSSGSQVEENYLLNVARDAIQRCTVGRVGDKILDELASSSVADFKQEYPQAELK